MVDEDAVRFSSQRSWVLRFEIPSIIVRVHRDSDDLLVVTEHDVAISERRVCPDDQTVALTVAEAGC